MSDLVDRPEAFRVDRAPETSGVVPPSTAHIDLAAAERAAALDAAELAEDIEVEPMPVVAEAEPEPVMEPQPELEVELEANLEADLEAEAEAEVELDPVHEPSLDMPPVVAVDGEVEFVDVTPISQPVAEDVEFAEEEALWTAPVAAWDEPSFAPDSAEPAQAAEAAPNLIDLTVPEEPLHPVFDPRDLPTLDTSSGPTETTTAQLEAPAPPLLVTAADFEPFSEDDTPAGELAVDEPTAPIPMLEETLFADPAEESSDPFLDQLRDAVAFDDVDLGDDALAAFFDHDEGAAGRGWFGRKR